MEDVKTALVEARATTPNPDAQRLGRIQQTGAWMSVLHSIFNGTELEVYLVAALRRTAEFRSGDQALFMG